MAFYAGLRSELGAQGLCDKWSLNQEELGLLNKVAADVDRRQKHDGGSEQEDRNKKIAQLRLLAWIETVAARTPAFKLKAEVEAAVSDETSRKQIRALELVIRSLVGERHEGQQSLLGHLRDMFGDRVVEKWLNDADRDNVLSGTAFSELASIFVNKQEFAHHEGLFHETPFLTLLREKRKTIQSFLEDIRRIRNALAHNKRITNIQLSLLDVYYDELMTPIAESHRQGKTAVDPDKYLDVSDSELEGYFVDLHDDVMSVKDDIADLKDALGGKLDVVAGQAADIKETTAGINKKVVAAIGLVVVVAVLGVIGVLQTLAVKEDLQNVGGSVGQIEQDTGELKRTSEEIAASGQRVEETTGEIRKAVGELAASNQGVVESLDEIRDGFRALASSGGIIADPKTPQEAYHNARIYEQDGKFNKARQSYAHFFTFDLALVDPHLRFQALLRLDGGAQVAREFYAGLKDRSSSFVVDYAALLLLDRNARVKRLAAFAEQHTDFAPVYFALSRDYSESQLGDQAASDKAAELEYLQKFLDLHNEGKFLQFMLDQELAQTQLADAIQRLEALKAVSDAALKNPVTITATKSSASWMVNIEIVGKAKEIFYRLDDEADFASTGHRQDKDTETGFALPNTVIELAPDLGATSLHVKYTDARDREQGPYEVAFDPSAALYRTAIDVLSRTTRSWVMFRDYDGKTLFYFTHLMTQRGALKEIRYGLDVEQPNQLFEFPPFNPDKPWDIGDKLPFIEVPGDTKFATVQLLFKDGSESKVERFERR